MLSKVQTETIHPKIMKSTLCWPTTSVHAGCLGLGLCHPIVPMLKNNFPSLSMRRLGTGRSWGRESKMNKIYCMNITKKNWDNNKIHKQQEV